VRLPAIDTSGLTEREYDLLRAYLTRRAGLDADAAYQLETSLAAVVRRQLGDQPAYASMSNEELIHAAVRSYRARFADRGTGTGV
jgi:hypothetical protein